jgi:hypothetical protein
VADGFCRSWLEAGKWRAVSAKATTKTYIEPPQEAIKWSLVGRLAQSQSPPQFAMLGQPNLGLAQGSVFVAYKAEDGQKLRLGKDVLGELGAIVVGQDGLGDLQSYPSQPNKPDLSDMLTVLDP